MSADTQLIAREVEDFVLKRSRLNGPLERDVEIFEAGFVDSIGVVELIAFLERRFEVEISDEILLSVEFGTIDGIARVVSRLGADG